MMVGYESLFSQLLAVFNWNKFELLVVKHIAGRYAKGFSCRTRFLSIFDDCDGV